MRVKRKDLHIGDLILYDTGGTKSSILPGTIIHIGLGLAARHAVWVRCLDENNRGNIECIMLENVLEVMAYVKR